MALNVGVVGMRGIGGSHANAHSNNELANLQAVCDIVKDRADAAAKQHGVKAYYSVQDMLDGEPDLDIVDVCTGGPENGGWHFEPSMEALEAGKHVLVEKPLSNEIEEGRLMVAKATEKGVYLACNVNHFFTQPCERARQYIDDGEVGELVFCVAKMGFQGGESKYTPAAGGNTGGFPYFHMKAFMTHPFSVMRHFCGDITHVQAYLDRPTFREEVNDPVLSTVSIHVRFANKGVGYLLSQRGDASHGPGGWWSIEVGGTKGSFFVENCVEKVSYWKAHNPRGPGRPAEIAEGENGAPVVSHSGTTDFGSTFPNRIHAFLEDVTNGVPKSQLRGSGRDALAALEYTFAAIESHEKGGELVIPHPLPPEED